MVYIGRFAEVPEEYTGDVVVYRLVFRADGQWDVYLDPPADVLGPPLVEAIDDELEN